MKENPDQVDAEDFVKRDIDRLIRYLEWLLGKTKKATFDEILKKP